MKLNLTLMLVFFGTIISAQGQSWQGKFQPIDNLLTPVNAYRTASGAPGHEYWQQRADYKIKAKLDETTNTISGEETINYFNNSPDELTYVWIQLEQNVNRKENEDFGEVMGTVRDSMNTRHMQFLTRTIDFPAGYTIDFVRDAAGKDLKHIINNTMMKVILPQPLKSGGSITLSLAWSYPVTDRSMYLLSREGYEYFPEDDNTVYLIAHWFPRMAVYNDTEGWQNKQFQKLGEFALEFGNYEVEITVPSDHVVASTGALQNTSEVLSTQQFERMKEAQTSFDKPVMIITPEEAESNEKTKDKGTKTWKFSAENVRDFAFASSRKFIWDAQAVQFSDHVTMAMSFYPKEGLPVWTEESTKAVIAALEVYSDATFEYPYPVAISVNTSNIGMEFPMISFNGGRPKNGEMLDQKTMAIRYPDRHSITPKDIVPYMSGDKSIMRPIMVSSDNENLSSIGANFYDKPTIGFQILRNSVVGPELFDEAFREYANRWKYKHPNPADLFRTLEDATATDLDWFYRGWFFTTDHVDVELADVKWFQIKEEEINIESKNKKVKSKIKGKDSSSEGKDFSKGPKSITMVDTDEAYYGGFLSRINDEAIHTQMKGKNIYQLSLKNVGGLIMPVTIEWQYTDGTSEIERLPAEIWNLNEYQVEKTFVKDKEVSQINLDPNLEYADTDMTNNSFPKVDEVSEFDKMKK